MDAGEAILPFLVDRIAGDDGDVKVGERPTRSVQVADSGPEMVDPLDGGH